MIPESDFSIIRSNDVTVVPYGSVDTLYGFNVFLPMHRGLTIFTSPRIYTTWDLAATTGETLVRNIKERTSLVDMLKD
ncbi:MAG: hypothetical protein ACP5NS_01930 [Candidatus Pacearchaeota archaeon]